MKQLFLQRSPCFSIFQSSMILPSALEGFFRAASSHSLREKYSSVSWGFRTWKLYLSRNTVDIIRKTKNTAKKKKKIEIFLHNFFNTFNLRVYVLLFEKLTILCHKQVPKLRPKHKHKCRHRHRLRPRPRPKHKHKHKQPLPLPLLSKENTWIKFEIRFIHTKELVPPL